MSGGGYDPRESEVQAAILEYLALARRLELVVDYWRANAGQTPVPDPTRPKGYRALRCNFAGCPDILGLLPGGRLLGIEVKAGPRAPVTAKQRAVLERWRAGGALVFVAWSVDMVADELTRRPGARPRRFVRPDHPTACEGSPL